MITLFAIGERKNIEWVKQLAAPSNFECSLITSLDDLPLTYVPHGAIFLDTLKDISFANLSNLVRKGYHLFLNTPFDLSHSELNHLSLLAEEAGVFVVTRLPLELNVPGAVGAIPLVGNVSLEIAGTPHGDIWRIHCLEAISGALSILPFAVKRVRCVSGGKQANPPSFMGCHLEFENTSLISLSISSTSTRNSLAFRFLNSSGSYEYSSVDHDLVFEWVRTREAQFSRFVELCNTPTQRFSVIGLDTITQIMKIYSEMKGHFVLA